MALIKINTSPVIEEMPLASREKINRPAPATPSNKPAPFSSVNFSFSQISANNVISIGVLNINKAA